MLQIAFIAQWYVRNYQVSCNFTLYDLQLAVFHRLKDRQFIYTLSIFITTTTTTKSATATGCGKVRAALLLLLVPCNLVQPAVHMVG